MLHNPYCSPSTSRATKTSGVIYIPPGFVNSVSWDVNNAGRPIRLVRRSPAFRRLQDACASNEQVGRKARAEPDAALKTPPLHFRPPKPWIEG